MEQEIVDIEGFSYSIGKLDGMNQFHVVRRLSPLLAPLAEAFKKAKEKDVPFDFIDVALGPLSEVVSTMSDTDVEYVINKCMSVCRRKTETGTWAPVFVKNGGLMYQNMSMTTMLRLTVSVVKENLGSFFLTEQQPSPVETSK